MMWQLRVWLARQLCRVLLPSQGYLTRLQRRMMSVGYSADDVLYMQTVRMQRSLARFLTNLDYLSWEVMIPRDER